MLLKRIAKNINRNHELAILISFLLGLGLITVVFTLGAALGMLSSLSAVLALFFIVTRAWSGIVAGASYIGRAIDLITWDKTLLHLFKKPAISKKKPASQTTVLGVYEQAGYGLGLLACTAISIMLILSGFNVPLLMPLGPVAAYAIFFIVSAGIFAGFCSRMGRLIDCYLKASSAQERFILFNRNYELAMLITAIAGFAISIAVLSTVGASALFPGLAVNPVLLGLFFTITFTGALVSGASYLGRALDYLFKEKTLLPSLTIPYSQLATTDKPTTELIADLPPHLRPYLRPDRYENRANIIGIGIALLLCTALVLTGCEIPLLAALHGLAYPALYITCIGIFGGLCSRIGRVIDRAVKQKPDKSVESGESKQSEDSNAPPLPANPEQKPKLEPGNDCTVIQEQNNLNEGDESKRAKNIASVETNSSYQRLELVSGKQAIGEENTTPKLELKLKGQSHPVIADSAPAAAFDKKPSRCCIC